MEEDNRANSQQILSRNIITNKLPLDHGKRWSQEEINDLLKGVINGYDWQQLAKRIHRKPSSIKSKFANIIIDKFDNIELAKILSASGSGEPPNNPKLVTPGIGIPPNKSGGKNERYCIQCKHPLGPRCECCGNTNWKLGEEYIRIIVKDSVSSDNLNKLGEEEE